jgi:hypothetical protein
LYWIDQAWNTNNNLFLTFGSSKFYLSANSTPQPETYISSHLPQSRHQPLIGPIQLEPLSGIVGQSPQDNKSPQLPVYIPIL